MLKRIVIGLMAVGLLAAPSLAQRYDPDAESGNIVQGPGRAPGYRIDTALRRPEVWPRL